MKTALNRRLFMNQARRGYAEGGEVKPNTGEGIASGLTETPTTPPQPAPMAMTMTEPVREATPQQATQMAQELATGFMSNIDAAETEEQLMDSMRTNQMTMEQRVEELADIVGGEDAKKTPPSVLMLLQPLLEQMNMQAGRMGDAPSPMDSMMDPMTGG
tara:strand:+ start:787 stop:1263 length:477 start_codon:yes stop_codon:yes gene_type:complete